MSRNKWKQLLLQKNTLLILGLVGLILVVISIPTESRNSGGDSDTADSTENGSGTSTQNSNDQYVQEMEKKLETILEETEGAGTVSVMITLKATSENVVEKDHTENNSESTGDSDSQTSEDISESTVFTESSDGTQSPYVSKTLTPEIDGIIIVADGGDDAVVVESITSAVKALFDVDMHKIKVMKRKSS
jgi:stage III sporulation protein AG